MLILLLSLYKTSANVCEDLDHLPVHGLETYGRIHEKSLVRRAQCVEDSVSRRDSLPRRKAARIIEIDKHTMTFGKPERVYRSRRVAPLPKLLARVYAC